MLSLFLSGTCGSCLTAKQQGAEDAGVVHSHFCLHGQLGVCPHTRCEAIECCSCLPDPFVHLSVQGEVVGDIKLIVVDGDGWW